MIDWYAQRDELRPGQIFRLHGGDLVRLDRQAPGDGTDWYVDANYGDDRWISEDMRIHPSDLETLVQ